MNKPRLPYGPLLVAASAALLFFRCSIVPLSGGGTEGGNVTGVFVNDNGSAAAMVFVQLIPADYDPGAGDQNIPIITTTTRTDGSYTFARVSKGNFTIQAIHPASGNQALICGIAVTDHDIRVPLDTLKTPGVMKVFLPGSAGAATGYVYVPGTTIHAAFTNTSGFVMVDAVPAGKLPAVFYSASTITSPEVIRYDVTVAPGDTTVVYNPSWKYARRLFLNTTAGGANVSGDVYNFPVLVRLTAGNFTFAEAKTDGSDLRFTKNDGTPLQYEIERYDAGLRQAEIWVKVDTVFGNDSSQSLTMYWGNPAAAGVSSGGSVFNTAKGFVGVWHLAGDGNAVARDATLNHYDGTPSDTAPQSIPGVIGNALQFDGNLNSLLMKNTAQSPLNFPRPGTYTFSAWVSVDSVYEGDEFIAGKGVNQYALRIKGNTSIPSNMFALHEYIDAPVYGTDMRYAPVVIKQWKYIVGIRDTAKSYLFIDGTCVDSTGMVFYAKGDPQDQPDFSIGRCLKPPNNTDYLPFKGKIDEVRIASVRFSADWIKLSYMNQKPDDMLIRFVK